MTPRRTSSSNEEQNNIEEKNLNLDSLTAMFVEDPNAGKVSIMDINKKVDTFPKEKVNEIIQQYASKSESDFKTALFAIACLCQSGGTNSSTPNMKKEIQGITFQLSTLREVVQYVMGKSATVRQLAKSMRNSIMVIAQINDWPGPLAKSLVKENPDITFTSSELVYAAEFNDDNPDPAMPENIKIALAKREAAINAQRRVKSESNKSPKKGRNKKNKKR